MHSRPASQTGNPARHVRWRFGQLEREALLRVASWEWSDESSIERVEDLNGLGVEEFLRRHDEQYAASTASSG